VILLMGSCCSTCWYTIETAFVLCSKTTNQLADSRVSYGLTLPYAQSTSLDGALVVTHADRHRDDGAVLTADATHESAHRETDAVPR
jgi:hypothetical protein